MMENQKTKETYLSSSTEGKFSKLKTALYRGLLQILPIMFGVYLGFSLNNFGEQQKLNQQKNTYEQMLKNEIQDNLKQIKKASIYHKKITKDFIDIRESNDIKKAFNDYSMAGLRPGIVSNSAFETGIQTGIIQEFDLETIQHLNKLYNYQQKYDNYNEQMLNSFLSGKFPDTESEIKSLMINLSMNMSDVENFERELQEYYQLILDKLNK